MSPEGALKAAIKEAEAKRDEAAVVLDEMHKELEGVRRRFQRQQGVVRSVNDRIEAMAEALHTLERGG